MRYRNFAVALIAAAAIVGIFALATARRGSKKSDTPDANSGQNYAGNNNYQQMASSTPPLIPSATIDMQALNDSGESGTVTLSSEGSKTKVEVNIKNEPADASQPAHIHNGSCSNRGNIRYQLNPVVNGKSDTLVNVPLFEIINQMPLALNVHKSADELETYVSCGDIGLSPY